MKYWTGCLGCFLIVAVAGLSGCSEGLEHQADSSQQPPLAQAPAATPEPAADPASMARETAVRSALEQGMPVDQVDELGRTSLMMAAFEGYTGVVSILLENGAEVDRRDEAGRTALMFAASGPFPKTVETLLEAGSDPNLEDTVESWTALMFAAGEGNASVVETLLRYGANPHKMDGDGDRAIDHARERNHPEVVELLEAAAD